MKLSFAKQIGATIRKSTIGVMQADGLTDMDVAGEVHMIFHLDSHNLYFDGLVTKDLSVDVLAGVPFMKANNVYACPSKQTVFFNEAQFRYNVADNISAKASITRVQPCAVRPPIQVTWTEDFTTIEANIDTSTPTPRSVQYQSCWLQPDVSHKDKHLSSQKCSSDLVSTMEFKPGAYDGRVGEYSELLEYQTLATGIHNQSEDSSVSLQHPKHKYWGAGDSDTNSDRMRSEVKEEYELGYQDNIWDTTGKDNDDYMVPVEKKSKQPSGRKREFIDGGSSKWRKSDNNQPGHVQLYVDRFKKLRRQQMQNVTIVSKEAQAVQHVVSYSRDNQGDTISRKDSHSKRVQLSSAKKRETKQGKLKTSRDFLNHLNMIVDLTKESEKDGAAVRTGMEYSKKIKERKVKQVQVNQERVKKKELPVNILKGGPVRINPDRGKGLGSMSLDPSICM